MQAITHDPIEAWQAAGRSEFVAQVRQYREEQFKQISRWQIREINEISGIDVCLRISKVCDDLVRSCWKRACSKANTEVDNEHWGIFAIGGTGRQEQCPGSDLDIMVIHDGVRDDIALIYQEFELLLWDSKFKVGASCRHINEVEGIIRDDFVTATALMEHRLLYGSMEDELQAALTKFRQKRSQAFFNYKIEELEKRRGKAEEILFKMEPDLKQNPGCLRDIQLLYACAFCLEGDRSLRELLKIDGIGMDDIRAVHEANEFLLQIRALLHFHHGRAEDSWGLQDQLRASAVLGYSACSRLNAVEIMMQEYYRHAVRVNSLVDVVTGYMRRRGLLGRTVTLIKTRRRITNYFVAIANQVYVSDRTFWQRDDAFLELVKMCREAQKRGARISHNLQQDIRNNASLMLERSTDLTEAYAQFMQILGEFGKVYPILQDMHRANLLGLLLPEFANVTCLMQFDSYHEYTIDQHTLLAVRNIDSVWNGELDGLKHMRTLLRETDRRSLLNLSILMHDVGKYMGRNHSERGAMMSSAVADRLGLSDEDEELLYWLILEHTSLSTASRIRDVSDPEFLREFSEMVETRERLDLLYCLTYADAKAVGELVLTGWQETLLAQLYDHTLHYLGNSDGTHVVGGIHQRFRNALLQSGVSEDAAQGFLSSMTDNYYYQTAPHNAPMHYRMLIETLDDPNAVALEWKTDIRSATIYIVMENRLGGMANLAAVATGTGLDIVEACCWSAIDIPRTLFRLRVESTRLADIENPEYWARFKKHLIKCSEPGYAEKLIDQRAKQFGMDDASDSGFKDPSVKIDQHSHPRYSILDIHETDEPGLLSRVCRLLADCECNIMYASINTMGDVAVNVFYIQHDGHKLSHEKATFVRKEFERVFLMSERLEVEALRYQIPSE